MIPAYSLFADVDFLLDSEGWVVERPFLPIYIQDGHFLVQMRKKGEPITEMYSAIIETLHETVNRGAC